MAEIFTMIIVLCVAFLVFILMREVWCWYWKINAIVASLGMIEALLRDQIAQTQRFSSSTVMSNADRRERPCPACSRPILTDARVCKHCGFDVVPLEQST